MTVITSYEVHVQSRDKWRIDCVFDDKSIAIEEAKHLLNGVISAVRVIEETFDDATDKTTTRFIFRSATQQNKNSNNKQKNADSVHEDAQMKQTRSKRKFCFSERLAFSIFVIGGCAASAFFALAYLVPYLH
ncbi:MAG: hypothetical protein IPK66_04325 [Rhodospirillales bacterium]|nr:hypothetical protein [Rhodospirillales bacterium]